MSNITRRTLLKQTPSALVLAAAPAGVAATALPAEAQPQENPALIAAHARFLAARAEVTAAEDALEWLVDEWRHRWPLAPEEILGGTNMEEWRDGCERDIAGRAIVRETSDLTARLPRKCREDMPRTTFAVMKPEFLKDVADRWEASTPGGKTPEGHAKQIARRESLIRKYRHKQAVSERYHAETGRLREESGVEDVKLRVKTAKAELNRACSDVSHEPAHTVEGLRLKADALHVQDEGMAPYMRDKGGALGAMARFIDATLDVIGRTSA